VLLSIITRTYSLVARPLQDRRCGAPPKSWSATRQEWPHPV